jgi:hypothetical protein
MATMTNSRPGVARASRPGVYLTIASLLPSITRNRDRAGIVGFLGGGITSSLVDASAGVAIVTMFLVSLVNSLCFHSPDTYSASIKMSGVGELSKVDLA